jgi:hypothetical protein
MSGYKKETASENRKFLTLVKRRSMARHGARLILTEIIAKANIYQDPPMATTTKGQLCAETGLSWNTVKGALKFLREEGSIFAVGGLDGGRTRAVTYRFFAVGEGATEAGTLALQDDTTHKKWAAAYTVLAASKPDMARAWLSELKPISATPAEFVLQATSAYQASYINEKLGQVLAEATGSKRVRVTGP